MKINYEDMLSSMYESPIRTFQKQLEMRCENEIMNAVAEYGIHVDKDELVKALKYDRNQYDKGYSDAINKYKWHDLRKNPEDLPSGNCYCCVLVEDGEYAICEYSVDCKCFGETVTEKHYELQSEPVESWFEGFDEDFIAIAWRYIEPFEDELNI